MVHPYEMLYRDVVWKDVMKVVSCRHRRCSRCSDDAFRHPPLRRTAVPMWTGVIAGLGAKKALERVDDLLRHAGSWY